MAADSLKLLRVFVIVLLVLLGFQYEFGMVVNIANPPSIAPFPFSLSAFSDAIHGVGPVALLHAGMGGLLAILSLVGVVMSLRSKIRMVQVFGSLGFLAVLLAGTSGLLFVLSGFQDDHFSHGMASNFLLAFTFYFVELYFLKPDSKPRSKDRPAS